MRRCTCLLCSRRDVQGGHIEKIPVSATVSDPIESSVILGEEVLVNQASPENM